MEDLSNIWTIDDELNEEQLLNYLQGNAPGDEAHSIEKQMADDAFVNDAIEGLQSFKSTRSLNEYVGNLNKKLQKKLDAKKQKKEKREIKHMGWVILAVIIILVLCVLGYVVIHMFREGEVRKHATALLQATLFKC